MDNLDDGKECDVGLGDGESSTHPREQIWHSLVKLVVYVLQDAASHLLHIYPQ